MYQPCIVSNSINIIIIIATITLLVQLINIRDGNKTTEDKTETKTYIMMKIVNDINITGGQAYFHPSLFIINF